MNSVKIGKVVIDCPVALAPMAGVTDLVFRELCREQGAGLTVTEMVSAKAISFHNEATYALMETGEHEHPVSLQIFGSEPELMAEVAAALEQAPFDILDINMGCPVQKVVGNGEGSYLMRVPEKAEAIVKQVSRATGKPVTVKFRKGFTQDEVNAPEFAARMEQAGAAAVQVHGRTRSQFYSGKADWDIIRQVKDRVSIPVFGNGDIACPQDALDMMEQTGCDGIMIGRAARGNPWLFARIRAALEGRPLPPPPSSEEKIAMILRHGERLAALKGERTAMREMRKALGWYTAGLPNASKLRGRTAELVTLEDLRNMVQSL